MISTYGSAIRIADDNCEGHRRQQSQHHQRCACMKPPNLAATALQNLKLINHVLLWLEQSGSHGKFGLAAFDSLCGVHRADSYLIYVQVC